MITPFGIFLRKLRLDNNEVMADMAEKLDVSISFLSAVELDKKNIPYSWFEKICKLYDLTDKQEKELSEVICLSKHFLRIDLSDLSDEKRSLVFLFERRLKSMRDEDVEKLNEFLNSILVRFGSEIK